jgi:hypothetical protein
VRRDALLKLYRELQRTEPKSNLALGTENLRRRIARTRKVIGP